MSLPPGPVSMRRFDRLGDSDPRGIFWMWEPPRPTETYVIGCDPTVGIEGWCRSLRVKDDVRTDNCAIEVIRAGRLGMPDVQVAEYSAPIAPYQQAAVLSHIGRMYRGSSDMGEALIVLEVWPGPGTAVIQPLVHIHGYTHFWTMKYLDQIFPSNRNLNKWPGWYSTPKSQRDLWLRANHFVSIPLKQCHCESCRLLPYSSYMAVTHDAEYERRRDENGVILRSPWLLDEMGDCEIDPVKMRAMALAGRHEDRWMAISLGLWGLHDWTGTPVPDVTEKPVRRTDWQASDISYEDMMDEWETRFDELMEV